MSEQTRPFAAAQTNMRRLLHSKSIRRVLAFAAPLGVFAVGLGILTTAGNISLQAAFFFFAVVVASAALAGGAGVASGTVSDRRARVLEGREALAQARALVAVLPDPCVLIGVDGRILFQNDQAREAMGRIAEGQPLSAFLRAPEMAAAVDRALQSGAPVHVDYVERVPVDRRYDAYIAPWAYADGAKVVNCLVLVLHDLTSHERLERMRADFVANASHELRTPLASLAGFIETLQGPARNDEAARERFLEIMRNQAMRMSRLIDDLLSLSRIEINAHVRPDKLVELGDVVRNVADALRPIAADAGVALQISGLESRIAVRGDRDQLVQVVQNLCENAIKYGAGGKKVELGLTIHAADGGRRMVRISVRDHGPGIAREHLPRLTERFYRVDVASSREKGGTGLGLAIVKHIVNRHRGTLAIESKPGEGACFMVTLEALPEQES